MEHKLFCAVGPHCWGVGPTLEKAVRNAKQNWPSWLKARPYLKNFSVWATDAPEFSVSDFDGSVSVENPYNMEKIQTSALAKK